MVAKQMARAAKRFFLQLSLTRRLTGWAPACGHMIATIPNSIRLKGWSSCQVPQ